MVRFLVRISPLMVLLAACTQQPVAIDLKGQNTYGRNNENDVALSHSSNSVYSGASDYQPYQPAPVYINTAPVQSAPATSIGVSDLSPPPTGKTAPINAWTQKSRFSDTYTAPESAKPTVSLNHIISNDNALNPAAGSDKIAAKPSGAAFMWPVSSRKIISGFGPKGDGKVNDGINIASSDGEPVWASADGEVVYVGNGLQGYGNMVLIKHAGGKTTAYAHLGRVTADKYDRVKQGDIIGYVGATGNVKTPQLHFAIREGKEPIDPTKMLKS